MAKEVAKQNTVTVSRLYGDYLIMLAAPCIMAVIYYGARAFYVLLAGVLSAVAGDFTVSALLKKKFLIRDLSNIFIGAAISLMMPAGVPLYVPCLAALFAVVAVKIPFGGSLRAPFVPVAAGFAFASVCFGDLVFSYTVNVKDKFLGAESLGSMLMRGSSVHLNAANTFDILSGNVAGPMGTSCGLLMLACCAYLFVRRRKALLATAGFVSACAVFAMLFPRINASPLTSLVLELSAGSLMFAAVFLVTDHATLPKGGAARVVYGAICGIICMVMRAVGAYEETVCFAVLLANGLRPVAESAAKAAAASFKKRKEAQGK